MGNVSSAPRHRPAPICPPDSLRVTACMGGFAVIAIITAVAIFILGALGASGKFPQIPYGWVTIGLASFLGAFTVSYGIFANRKEKVKLASHLTVTLVALAIFLTLASLAVTHKLSTVKLGWTVIGLALAAPVAYGISHSVMRSCSVCCRKK